MKISFLVFCLLTFFILQGCKAKPVQISDPNIKIFAGKVFYKNEPFTGTLLEEIAVLGQIQTTEFQNGVEDGEQISIVLGGQVLEKRYYENGMKEGIHRSWFPNGNRRLYSKFINGRYVGDRMEWFDNGQLAIYEKYDENSKILVTKKWNQNGKIYMNVVFSDDGSSVGLPGSKICKPIYGSNAGPSNEK
jgi:antitoxin component YwqK of YwqJK toxin-antitoxin module